jgi:hypothetical protein
MEVSGQLHASAVLPPRERTRSTQSLDLYIHFNIIPRTCLFDFKQRLFRRFSQCITSASAVCGSHGNVLCFFESTLSSLVRGVRCMKFIPYLNIPLSCSFSHKVDYFSLVRSKENIFHMHSMTYLSSDRRLSAKLMPTFADRGCHVVSAANLHGLNFDFLDRSRYYFFQVSPQMSSRGWVDPVPDSLLLRKSGSTGNRIRDLWICSQKL